MAPKQTIPDLGKVLTAGDPYTFNWTLKKSDGTIYDPTGFTLTATIQELGVATDLVVDHAVTIVSGVAGTVKMELTKAESALLQVPPATEHTATVQHICDVLVVESGAVEGHYGPFTFPVRRKITGN